LRYEVFCILFSNIEITETVFFTFQFATLSVPSLTTLVPVYFLQHLVWLVGDFLLRHLRNGHHQRRIWLHFQGILLTFLVYSILSNLLNHSYSYRQALPNHLFYSYSDAVFLFFPHRYCVSGTIGHKLMCGKPTRIDYKDTHIDVRCQVDFHLISYFAKKCTILNSNDKNMVNQKEAL